eukprot:Skav214860  [mRNA]  locus=scaffold16:504019:531885:+ [translate_table: standard]
MAAYPATWADQSGMQTPMMYAQPGVGYYDPSYGSAGYAGYAPDAQMSKEQKLQAKEARRQKKLLEASERCDKMREKLKQQDKSDASCFLVFMSIAYIGLGSLLGATMILPAWASKEFTGFGAGLISMQTSLFNLHIDVECDKSLVVEAGLCKRMMKPFAGDHDMQRTQGNSCALVPSACEVLTRCYTASIPLFGCIALCVLTSYAAAFCLFAYSKSSADPALRLWAGSFTLVTPILATAGIVSWALLMPDLGEIPRSWTQLADGLGFGGSLGIKKPVIFSSAGRSSSLASLLRTCGSQPSFGCACSSAPRTKRK